jgi:hypothetical protein
VSNFIQFFGTFNNMWGSFQQNMKQQVPTRMTIITQRWCYKCKRDITKGKHPVANVLNGKGYCSLLCYMADSNLLEAIDIGG